MNDRQLTRLLVVANGTGAPNRLISGLRSRGLALRTASAANARELATLLGQEGWDLLVSYTRDGVSPDSLLSQLRHRQLELPVLLVTPDPGSVDPVHGLAEGNTETFSEAEEQQLLLAVLRNAELVRQARELRHLQLRYRELEQRHQSLLAGAGVAVAYVRDGIHLYCNQAYAEAFGHASPEHILACPLLDLLPPDEQPRLKELLRKAQAESQGDTLRIVHRDGDGQALRFDLSPVEFQGKPCLQLLLKPAPGNRAYQAAASQAAGRDLLTRLDNRTRFLESLENAIRRAVDNNLDSALLLVELDEFVDISSALGRSRANLVLSDIAQHLRNEVGKPFAAARLDTHSFGLLLNDGDPDHALTLASAIQANLNSRVSPALSPALSLRCSIGLALINGHARDAEEVLARARNNLRKPLPREGGTDEFRIGDNLRHAAGEMLDYLKLALAERRFRLLYQPLVHIKGDGLKRYEVLARMLDRDDNEVSPGAFLSLVNLNGMGEELDRLVIELALASIGSGKSSHGLLVNITANTLHSRTFLPWLSDALHQARIPADFLILQVSEIDLHQGREQALEFCRGLHELNLPLAISHFGCALDPFAPLQELAPGYVKLDETVVRDLAYSAQQKANVRAMIEQLHARKLAVIVPQVEAMDLLPVLWETGADFVQGYCLQGPSQEMNYEFVQVEEITLPATRG